METIGPVACFFANKGIKIGEELTNSYGPDDALFYWRQGSSSKKFKKLVKDSTDSQQYGNKHNTLVEAPPMHDDHHHHDADHVVSDDDHVVGDADHHQQHDHHVDVHMTITRHHQEHIQPEMSSSRVSEDLNKTLLEGSSMSISDFSMMPSSCHDSPFVEMEKGVDTGNLISRSINVLNGEYGGFYELQDSNYTMRNMDAFDNRESNQWVNPVYGYNQIIASQSPYMINYTQTPIQIPLEIPNSKILNENSRNDENVIINLLKTFFIRRS